jgi:precorrin-6B methylase 1
MTVEKASLHSPGSLTIVGTGIQAGGQITIQARAYIEQADYLFFLVTDPVTERYLRRLNINAESLMPLYQAGEDRFSTYMAMVDRILAEVRRGSRVCAAFYGHPGVFVSPSHEAIRRARREGFEAKMLPGISAEDCLFADLGIDPSVAGCQSFEATGFLISKKKFDPTSFLILWQIGVIGDLSYQPAGYDYHKGLQVLAEYLQPIYGPDHVTIVYEASEFPMFKPRRDRVKIQQLPETSVTPLSTLCIPPLAKRTIDETMCERLGLDPGTLHEIEIDLT